MDKSLESLSKSMEKFYEYHPGSLLGEKLIDNKDLYIQKILANHKSGVASLVEEFGFGKKTEFWDDFVFSQIFVPVFNAILKMPILEAIDAYSIIDHLLFSLYIRRDEDPVRFRRAFWNVNSYGVQLARLFYEQNPEKKFKSKSKITNVKNICFVFKGPYALAHSEFLHEFLVGTKHFINSVKVTLLLLDEDSIKLQNKGVDHVNVVSLRNILPHLKK